MKYLQIIILSVTAFLLISCNNEAENITMLDAFEKETNTVVYKPFTAEKNTFFSVEDHHRNLMYMTSFLTGVTLLEDQDAREYFYSLLNNKGSKINLKDLLDNTNNPFEKGFKTYYDIYNWSITPKGVPTPPVSNLRPDPLDRPYEPLTMLYVQFQDTVTTNHNWEFYLPNKALVLQYINFDDYLNDKDEIVNLWSLNDVVFEDGLKMSLFQRDFITEDFNYQDTLESIFIIKLRENTDSNFKY